MTSQRDQQHLKKVGLEGFALIDECYGRPRGSNQSQRLQSPQPQAYHRHRQSFYYQVQHQQSYVCQVTQVYMLTKEPVTDYPVASQHQYHGGRGISEGGQQVFVAKESAVCSNEAAQFYGRMMLTGYSKNKPLRQAYY